MSNPTFKPSEGKREEFRKYLEKNGVMDALTKVLVNLYEEAEKPEDALEYIRDRLAMQAGLETFNQMKTKCDEYQSKIEQLEQEMEQLKVSLEPPAAEPEVLEPEGEGLGEGEVAPVDDALDEPASDAPRSSEAPRASQAAPRASEAPRSNEEPPAEEQPPPENAEQ